MVRIAVILCALFWTTAADAKWKYRYDRSGERRELAGVEFHNMARAWQTIDLAGENMLVFAPTTHGVAFTTGHSFLVHDRPFLRIINFGFDAVWFDLEYGNWRRKVDGRGKWMHKLDMGMGVGPALHLAPLGDFEIHAYFRFVPTLSFVTHNFAGDEDGKFELVSGFASYFSTGLAVSWSVFSVGGEYRHGGGLYRGIRIPDITVSSNNIDELLDLKFKDALDKQRHRMKGWRLYLSFRF